MRNTIKVNNHRLISRSDLAAIADMIPHGAKILDLGSPQGVENAQGCKDHGR